MPNPRSVEELAEKALEGAMIPGGIGIVSEYLRRVERAIRTYTQQQVVQERYHCMDLLCQRCAGDPRGPGQHEIEKCDAAAIRGRQP